MFLSGVAIRTLSLFFFLLRQPLSGVWWLPTNRHRLHTNRHRLHTNRHRLPTNRHRLPTNRHRLPTNRHRLHTNRHRLHTNRHRLPTGRHQLPTGRHHRAYWTLRVVFFFILWRPLVSMGAIQRGTSWATIPKTLNRARTVHAPCAHRATMPPRTLRTESLGGYTVLPPPPLPVVLCSKYVLCLHMSAHFCSICFVCACICFN